LQGVCFPALQFFQLGTRTMKIKAVMFDIDGTLVDSNDMHVLAWEEAFLGIGRAFDQASIHRQIGKGADMLISSLVPGLDEEVQQTVGDAQGAIFREKYRPSVEAFPGAHALIAHVNECGQKVVLASSASNDDLKYYVELLDIRNLVTATTSSADVENTKPAPDIFAVALEKVSSIDAGEVIVVGDTPYDIEAAKKNGIETIALRSGGFSDETLNAAGALAIYDDVASLLADYAGSPLGSD